MTNHYSKSFQKSREEVSATLANIALGAFCAYALIGAALNFMRNNYTTPALFFVYVSVWFSIVLAFLFLAKFSRNSTLRLILPIFGFTILAFSSLIFSGLVLGGFLMMIASLACLSLLFNYRAALTYYLCCLVSILCATVLWTNPDIFLSYALYSSTVYNPNDPTNWTRWIATFAVTGFLIITTIRVFSDRLALLSNELFDSEREKAELELRLLRAEKLQFMRRVSGDMAHQLNNLLTPILGFSDELLSSGDPLSSDQHECVTDIHNAAKKADVLLLNLLAATNTHSTELEPLSLNHVISQLEPQLREAAGDNIGTDFKLSKEPLCIVVGKLQLEQVVTILTHNAIYSMPDGGTLSISTEICNVDTQLSNTFANIVEPGTYCILSVADSGVGMEDSTIRHLFEPLFSTANKVGSGLGLSIVYGIIDMLKGGLQVISEPGKGSTFKVYLPISDLEKSEST